MKNVKFIVLISSCFFLLNSFSQIKIENAKVVSFKECPLKGVPVLCKKTNQIVKTDSLGLFSIVVNKNDILVIKAEGFEAYTVKIRNDNPLNINLKYKGNDEAYKSVLKNEYLSKAILDSCIENSKVGKNNFDRMLNIYEIIQYVYPAVQFSSDKKVILESRGPNSIFSGNEALLVVDGIVTTDISGISPTQIKSVKVLIGNDAADWGSRGGNGVVEIELKSK